MLLYEVVCSSNRACAVTMAIDQTFRVLPLLVLLVLRFISQRRRVSTFQLRAVCQRAGNDAVVATAEGLRSHAISVQSSYPLCIRNMLTLHSCVYCVYFYVAKLRVEKDEDALRFVYRV
ncbi:hypothetical protein BofuT4_P088550.1 [Botrytis cinerea T4]|uniref:Uncharacterized protein n=1 Tax=Botryotinia fuckeliana (strain T4) TaxID=999810 RepID=G2YG94_BOTF4|nr:hypothetical protein BofuT4_P088550.1 [Botrytis cinerea T4]